MKRPDALVLLAIAASLLSGCLPPTGTVESPEPPQSAVPSPPPAEPTESFTTLTVCQDTEPETLYLYGGSSTARNILEAIYDGPIDHRSYAFQPVILETLPSLEEGDAYFDTTTVQEGDLVVDVTGQPVELATGTQVFASHTCLDATNADCVTTFTDTPIEMEQMVVYWQILEGVAWSDGEPVTADDSVYSYELACDPDTPTSKYLCDRTDSYTAAGERTTVWTGIPGYVDDLYFLNFFSPLPQHLWKEQLDATAADLLARPESTQEPIGWGPFVITEWVQGEHVTLERNPAYFRTGEGLPRADRVIFRFASDANELVMMLLAGQCDIGLISGDDTTLTPLLVSGQEQGLLSLIATSSSDTWEHLEFGIDPARTYNRPDFFGDTRTRQAIAYCVDRQTIADEATFGMGEVADSYVPPEHPLYAGSQLTRWDHDPAAGQALLEEVGWMDKDGDGWVEAREVDGVTFKTPFRVNLLTVQGDSQQETVARIIRSNLADCGIQVDLEYVPSWDFFADGPAGPLFGRQFDLALFAWYNDAEPPCDLYTSDQIPDDEDWGLPNAAGFSNEEYDTACRAARAALPGTYEHTRSHTEAQQIFSEQLPALPLFWRPRTAITRPGVEGFALDPSEESEMWGIEEIGLTETSP